MRIVAGLYRGRRCYAKVPAGVRPTADSLRETIFNVINNHMDIDGCIVADICAGTGFMGFEALSRGAVHCHFVEKSKSTAVYINNAAGQMKIPSESYSIHQLDALVWLKTQENKAFDLVFIDPPYAANTSANLSNNIIGLLYGKNLISAGGMIVVEASFFDQIIIPDNWNLVTTRSHGDTKAWFIQIS